jgi:hypothetical protein
MQTSRPNKTETTEERPIQASLTKPVFGARKRAKHAPNPPSFFWCCVGSIKLLIPCMGPASLLGNSDLRGKAKTVNRYRKHALWESRLPPNDIPNEISVRYSNLGTDVSFLLIVGFA